MSALKLVLWTFLAILGAVALAFVVGFVNPQEKVNGLWLVVAAACILVCTFQSYGRRVSRRVVELNERPVMPATRLNDGVTRGSFRKVLWERWWEKQKGAWEGKEMLRGS